jgi:hypothetical protein
MRARSRHACLSSRIFLSFVFNRHNLQARFMVWLILKMLKTEEPKNCVFWSQCIG